MASLSCLSNLSSRALSRTNTLAGCLVVFFRPLYTFHISPGPQLAMWAVTSYSLVTGFPGNTPEMMLPVLYTVLVIVLDTELDRLDLSLLNMSMVVRVRVIVSVVLSLTAGLLCDSDSQLHRSYSQRAPQTGEGGGQEADLGLRHQTQTGRGSSAL